jgi:hypothetical protein
VAGLIAKTTDTTTAGTTTAAAACVRGGLSPLEPPSEQPKHGPVCGAGHDLVTGDDGEQQREAQLQGEAQQREAQQLQEEQQREAPRVLASRAGCGPAATTNEAAAGECERPIPKQAAAAADASVPDGPSPCKTTSAPATDTG